MLWWLELYAAGFRSYAQVSRERLEKFRVDNEAQRWLERQLGPQAQLGALLVDGKLRARQ